MRSFLPPDVARRVVGALSSQVTPPRLERMQQILAKRKTGIQLALENVQDGHNAAACLRSADAFGIMHVHAIERLEEFQPAKEISTGTHRWLRIHKYQHSPHAIAALREQNAIVMVSDLSPGALSMHDALAAVEAMQPRDAGSDQWRPIALVMGNETRGVSAYLRKQADVRFYLPMVGMAQSFNLSVACAISLTHVTEKFPHVQTLSPDEQIATLADWLLRDVDCARAIIEREKIPLDDV